MENTAGVNSWTRLGLGNNVMTATWTYNQKNISSLWAFDADQVLEKWQTDSKCAGDVVVFPLARYCIHNSDRCPCLHSRRRKRSSNGSLHINIYGNKPDKSEPFLLPHRSWCGSERQKRFVTLRLLQSRIKFYLIMASRGLGLRYKLCADWTCWTVESEDPWSPKLTVSLNAVVRSLQSWTVEQYIQLNEGQ